MTYKHVKKDQFVIEYGDTGDEFYLILDGECEVLVPPKQMDELKQIQFEMNVIKEQLQAYFEELKMMKDYQAELTEKKRQEDELKLIKVPTRRMTKVI